ncbi:MAG TPA: ATP phosphoribosyltransferase regulatory subunit [Clostridia bacterium]|nr:ATP phosphoribosyltransferase regulatory subunit [Clostridia bacterium]
MKKWKQHTPQGVQDYLPEECYNKGKIEESIRQMFFSRGYDEIESPVFEFYDVFTGDKTYIEQEKMYKIVEAGGRIQVLRPDITMPIARMVGTKLRDAMLPIRLSYLGNVYRYEGLQTGNQREVAQAGIELFGVDGPEADAEVISTAIEVFLSLGLEDFQIDIGQVDFFKGLTEDAGLTLEVREELRFLIEQKNLLALETLLGELPIDGALKNIFMQLPSMYGDIDVLKQGLGYTKNPRCLKAIENIHEVYEILDDFGLSKYITFDLGMVHSLNYYTGIIFRGFTKNLGFPICGGGRYDNLLREFGYDLPATGFAMGLKRLLVALDRQKKLTPLPGIDILVVPDRERGREGYNLIKRLREEGNRVEVYLKADKGQDPFEYARARGILKVIDMKDYDREGVL